MPSIDWACGATLTGTLLSDPVAFGVKAEDRVSKFELIGMSMVARARHWADDMQLADVFH